MRIIFIPYLPSAVRALPMAKYLTKSGNEVHMVVWDMPYPVTISNLIKNILNSWKYEMYVKDKIVFHKIRRLPFFFPLLNTWLFKKQIRTIFKEYKIDVVISETYFNETEPPLDLPIVYDMSDDHEAYPEIYGSIVYKTSFILLGVKKTIRNQIEKSKFVLAVSDSLVKYSKKYRSDKIFKLTNGVEGWVFKIKYKIGKKNSLVYVTNFGRWSELIKIIHAVYELKRDYPNIKLVLIGDGDQIFEAKKLVKKLKLEKNVNFLKRISDRKKLFAEINKYQVCLNISQKNNFRDSASPMKVFEYSALAKKVVSTNLTEVLNLNFPNIFFYEDDLKGENLKNAIIKAFKTKIDTTKTRKMVNEFSWEKLIGKLNRLLSQNIK